MRERVDLKSPVRENRPPGSVRGAPGNRRPYRDEQEQEQQGEQEADLDLRLFSEGNSRLVSSQPYFRSTACNSRYSSSASCGLATVCRISCRSNSR